MKDIDVQRALFAAIYAYDDQERANERDGIYLADHGNDDGVSIDGKISLKRLAPLLLAELEKTG